jgi:hypothetical protein
MVRRGELGLRLRLDKTQVIDIKGGQNGQTGKKSRLQAQFGHTSPSRLFHLLPLLVLTSRAMPVFGSVATHSRWLMPN